MRFRTLGKTGLKCSVVGFGASPLGAEFGEIDPEEGQRAVEAALDAGINYFDTSPYYGRTLSESRLGEYLEGRRDEAILATKVGRYDTAGFDFSADRVTRSVDQSLERLRTEWIDIIQVHDLEFGDLAQIIEETVPALDRLRESGKVRFVGITGYPLTALARVAGAVEVDTILSYCRYNLMDTTLNDMLLPLVKRKEIGLINGSPLHMRVLTERGAPSWHPAPGEVHEAAARAREICRRAGVDLADLAMSFALQHEDVAVTLVGMSKVAHVEANVRAVEREADPDLLEQVRQALGDAQDVYWVEGRPENADPGAVPKRGREEGES